MTANEHEVLDALIRETAFGLGLAYSAGHPASEALAHEERFRNLCERVRAFGRVPDPRAYALAWFGTSGPQLVLGPAVSEDMIRERLLAWERIPWGP